VKISRDWIMLESALEVLTICRSAGKDEFVPFGTFYAYTSFPKNTVKAVIDRMVKMGILERRYRPETPGRRVARNPTLGELCSEFAPFLVPPEVPSCDRTMRLMCRIMRIYQNRKIE